jgi:hypothetical protein
LNFLDYKNHGPTNPPPGCNFGPKFPPPSHISGPSKQPNSIKKSVIFPTKLVGSSPYIPIYPGGPENQRTIAASCRPTLEFLDPPGFKKLFFVQSDLIDSSSIIGKRKKRCDIFLPINACCVESLQLSLEEIDFVASHFFFLLIFNLI